MMMVTMMRVQVGRSIQIKDQARKGSQFRLKDKTEIHLQQVNYGCSTNATNQMKYATEQFTESIVPWMLFQHNSKFTPELLYLQSRATVLKAVKLG